MKNYMKLEIAAIGNNESFARSAVAAFALSLNPSLSELSDIKTAVSEAVTNCIVHAYKGESGNKILIECETEASESTCGVEGEKASEDKKEKESSGILHIRITDYGCGIADVDKALQPFYTTLQDDERSGMGFTIMQTFMSDFSVESKAGEGTSVSMSKKIGVKDGVNA